MRAHTQSRSLGGGAVDAAPAPERSPSRTELTRALRVADYAQGAALLRPVQASESAEEKRRTRSVDLSVEGLAEMFETIDGEPIAAWRVGVSQSIDVLERRLLGVGRDGPRDTTAARCVFRGTYPEAWDVDFLGARSEATSGPAAPPMHIVAAFSFELTIANRSHGALRSVARGASFTVDDGHAVIRYEAPSLEMLVRELPAPPTLTRSAPAPEAPHYESDRFDTLR